MSETPTQSMLDPDEALALWSWIWEELESPVEAMPSWRTRSEIATSLLDLLSFAACELSLAGRHEWVERLPDMLRLHRGWLMHEQSPRDKCSDAIGDLLRQGAPLTKAVEAMARSSDSYLRAVVANSLPLEDPDARPLLEALATDPNRHVREAARQRLPAGQPSAWWVGTFDSDPIPRLPELDDELLAALRTVALFANREHGEAQAAMLPQLAEVLPRLPAPILFEVARRFVTFEHLTPGYLTMLDELLVRPGGAQALWDMLAARLGKPHGWAHLSLILGWLCKELDEARREPLCRGLLAALVEHRHARRAQSMARIVESVVRERWPASLPGALALDSWETLAGDAPELAKILLPLLWAEAVDLRGELGRLLALAEADDELVRPLASTVARLEPEPRRAFVGRGLASERDAVRALALEQLATLPPDPGEGAAVATFTRYWSEPALRRTIVSNDTLSEIFCPYLRRQLRAGALGLSEVAATLRAIGRLWGGTHETSTAKQRARRLEHGAAWHAGAAETGPPTEQEWACWRTLRRQELDEQSHGHAPRLLMVRPAGPLHPDDREIIDQLMDHWRQTWATTENPSELGGPHFHETMTLFYGLYEVVDTHALACTEEILAALEAAGGDRHLIDMFSEQVEELRHNLAPL